MNQDFWVRVRNVNASDADEARTAMFMALTHKCGFDVTVVGAEAHASTLGVTLHSVNALRDICHQAAYTAGWWHVKCREFYPDFVDSTNSATVDVRTLPSAVFKLWCASKIALAMTEGAEAFEGLRRGLQDEHLPQYSSEVVELADMVIRAMDYAGGKDLDIGGAIMAKLAYNATRADHRPEERAKVGGKEF